MRGRRLPTTIFYPAQDAATGIAAKNATPDRAGGPYPLIVAAHGFGGSVAEMQALSERWAAAGYVVAEPLFPLTNERTPGGPDAADYINQPADMSYVITSVLQASARSDGQLAGLVDPNQIGAAGHSLGGITTLGLAANTCCHDPRVKAAIVFSGDSEGFPHGRFDYAHAPPMMFVHGTADPVVPYQSSVDAFNLANGPKALVSVIGGGHDATVGTSGPWFAGIARVTTDFFNAYVKGDHAAANGINTDAVAGLTRIVFDPDAKSIVTVPTTAAPPVPVHHASATPTTGLTNGETVVVHWSDYAPHKTVNIVECSRPDTLDASACDLKNASLLQPDPTGTGTGTIKIVAGSVGSGTCDATHSQCVVIVNDGGALTATASVRIPITFAAK
jgi:dienelactone hydrolase